MIFLVCQFGPHGCTSESLNWIIIFKQLFLVGVGHSLLPNDPTIFHIGLLRPCCVAE